MSVQMKEKETANKQTLPHWDMTVVYPGLDSPEFETGFQELVAAIDELAQLFDAHNLGREQAGPMPAEQLDAATIALFEQALAQINQAREQASQMRGYIHGFVSVDSRDALAQAKMSQLQMQQVRIAKLGTRLIAWVGTLPVEALIARSESAADHAYALRKAQVEASHLLSPAEEELAAELGLTGGSAWSKLYGDFTSQLMVSVELETGEEQMPMSSVRNLAFHQDRSTRLAGYQAELTAWEEASVPIAASLNSIKGEKNTMLLRKGWASALDQTCFQNNMDRQSLEAMMEAARDSLPDFRRYLQAKARALNLNDLAWYDIFAPISREGRTWGYDEAADFIVEQFGNYSSKMRDLARRAFQENWIDAGPRPGKRGGAFCMNLRPGESRILANYKGSFNDVSTLAHELGHAYHNLNLAERTQTQRMLPMTLAETASIFCQTIAKNAALRQVGPQEQLTILETSLQSECQVVVDIHSRYLFEQSVFERRQERELSADEFCELMLDAQRRSYGDGLDQEQLHPYMWAAKPHYYFGERSFYNYPYMFGLLFGLGLYARYQEAPESFRGQYDDLLSSTGMYPAAELADRFGIDIQTPAFWRSSLDVVRKDIDRFEGLVQA